MFIRKDCPRNVSAEKRNDDVIGVTLAQYLNKEINTLAHELERIDKIKHSIQSDGEPPASEPEHHALALGLHNSVDSILKRLDPLVKQTGYGQFIEGHHKSLQELKIKFLLKSIVENPLNWEDYSLSCEIYESIMTFHQSARCTLNQSELINQNLGPDRLQKFLAVFKYNFAYNLAFQPVPKPADKTNVHYYFIVRSLTAAGLDGVMCHTLANIRNAIRICRESYRESHTPGEENDELFLELKGKDLFYINFYASHFSIDIGAGQ